MDELKKAVGRFVSTSRVSWGVGQTGVGVPFVGCGAGFGFFSAVEIPFVGGLLSTVARNVLAADSALTGGFLRRVGHISSRIPGVSAGAGCGIGIGYGYGAGIFLSPGMWTPPTFLSVGQTREAKGGSGGGKSHSPEPEGADEEASQQALSSRIDRLEERMQTLERRIER
jgi:hypothetical protein